MRELKFRVWDEAFKKMRYNYMLEMDWPTTGEKFDHGVVGPFIPFAGRWKSPTDFEYFPIMQYTGLKDKNGKEIYESDVVTLETYGTCKVLFDEAMFKYVLIKPYMEDDIQSEVSIITQELYPTTRYLVEIIGNVYETPELING